MVAAVPRGRAPLAAALRGVVGPRGLASPSAVGTDAITTDRACLRTVEAIVAAFKAAGAVREVADLIVATSTDPTDPGAIAIEGTASRPDGIEAMGGPGIGIGRTVAGNGTVTSLVATQDLGLATGA